MPAGLTHFGPTCMETYSGIEFDLANPRPEAVDLDDIAVGLSNTCRFNGQVRKFYSVAEHSVLVADILAATGYGSLSLAGLLHDASEAYLGDLISPIKGLIEGTGDWDALTDNVDEAIGLAFGINVADLHHPYVKVADLTALRMETDALCSSKGRRWNWRDDIPQLDQVPEHLVVTGHDPRIAQYNFMLAFERYHG